MTRLEHLELGGVTLYADNLAFLEKLNKLKSLTIRACKTENADDSLFSGLPVLPRLETLDLSYSTLQGRDLRRLSVMPRLRSLRMGGAMLNDEAQAEFSQLDFLEEVEIANIWEYRTRMPLAEQLKPLLTIDRLKVVRILDVFPAIQLPLGIPDQLCLKLDDGRKLPVWNGDVNGVRRMLGALRKSKPGIVIDVRLDFSLRDLRLEESAWDDYERLPNHNPSWLPESDVPWMTPAERADFEQKGGWARFDAARWGAEEASFASF
jgi:hypothetical protein